MSPLYANSTLYSGLSPLRRRSSVVGAATTARRRRWRVKVLDFKTRTVPLSYVHGIWDEAIEQVGPGSWYLPLLSRWARTRPNLAQRKSEPMSSAGAGSPTRFWGGLHGAHLASGRCRAVRNGCSTYPLRRTRASAARGCAAGSSSSAISEPCRPRITVSAWRRARAAGTKSAVDRFRMW